MFRLAEITKLIRKIKMSKQKQKGGKDSTNIQAENVTINQGLSVADVKNIALDLFQTNFLELSKNASEIAGKRAEEITNEFLKKLQEQNPDGLGQAEDPDFQYSLFTVQKEYARNGDKELGDLLVDLLIDRSKHQSRDILQIVLNESLSVAPKLTADQLAALSVIFVVRYSVHKGLINPDALAQFLDGFIQPFSDLLTKKNACYQHLEYSGCGTVSIGSVNFASALQKSYKGLFSKGFDLEVLNERGLSISDGSPLLERCFHDAEKWQIIARPEEVLRLAASQEGFNQEDIEKLIALTNDYLMNESEIEEYLKSMRSYLSEVIDIWHNSSIKNFTLTSVGIAIAHANLKKNLGEFTNLAIWIN